MKVGRIQNFKNWSPEMVPDPSKTCLGLEYFCFEGDSLWTTSDARPDPTGHAGAGTDRPGATRQTWSMERSCECRKPIRSTTLTMRKPCGSCGVLGRLRNLHLVGRNGMHKYNNQDHSMLTAMLAVRIFSAPTRHLAGERGSRVSRNIHDDGAGSVCTASCHTAEGSGESGLSSWRRAQW